MNTLILPNEKANYLKRFWIACFALVLILFAFNSTSVSAAIVSGVASFKTIGNSNSGNTWLTIGPANSLNSYDTIAKGNDNDQALAVQSFTGFHSIIMILPLILLVALFLGNAGTYFIGIKNQQYAINRLFSDHDGDSMYYSRGIYERTDKFGKYGTIVKVNDG